MEEALQSEVNFKTNINNRIIIELLVNIFKSLQDPEIPINLYDLGIIYEVYKNNNILNIKLQLTAIGCPYYQKIINDLKQKINEKLNINDIDIEFIYDPPWTPSRLTHDGRELFKAVYGYDPVEKYEREQVELSSEQEIFEE